MRELEQVELEFIQAGDFWGSFCATSSIVAGTGGIVAGLGLIAVSGGSAAVVIGVVGLSCGLAYYVNK
jgi:hypothetical protein